MQIIRNFIDGYNKDIELIKLYTAGINKNKIVIARILSIIYSLFFISAPLAILINLLLFVQYFYLVTLGIALILLLFCSLSGIIYNGMVSRLSDHHLPYRRQLILNIIIYGAIIMALYLVANIVWSVFR